MMEFNSTKFILSMISMTLIILIKIGEKILFYGKWVKTLKALRKTAIEYYSDYGKIKEKINVIDFVG